MNIHNQKYFAPGLIILAVGLLAAFIFPNATINYQDGTILTHNPLTIKIIRPLTVYLFDHPKLFHFISMLLHLFNGLLLQYILERVFKDKINALMVTLIFLLHPVQVESLSIISEVMGLLSTGLFLLAILFYQYGKVLGGRLNLILTIPFRPAFVLIAFVGFFYQRNKKQFQDVFLFLVGTCYLVYFISIIDFSMYSLPNSFSGFLLELLGMLGFTLKQFFIPYPLAIYYGVNEIWLRVIFLVFAFSFLAFALVAYVKRMDSYWAFLLILALTLPFSFRFADSHYLNDRHLYSVVIPIAFLATVFCFAKFRILFYPYIVALAAMSCLHTANFESELDMLKNSSVVNKGDGKAVNDLGLYYQRNGDPSAAKREFELALREQVKWNKHYPLNSLGLLLSNPKDRNNFDPDLAYEMYVLAMEFAPREGDKITPLFNLANLYITQKNYTKAVALFEQLKNIGKEFKNSQNKEILELGEKKQMYYLKELKKAGYRLKK